VRKVWRRVFHLRQGYGGQVDVWRKSEEKLEYNWCAFIMRTLMIFMRYKRALARLCEIKFCHCERSEFLKNVGMN